MLLIVEKLFVKIIQYFELILQNLAIDAGNESYNIFQISGLCSEIWRLRKLFLNNLPRRVLENEDREEK